MHDRILSTSNHSTFTNASTTLGPAHHHHHNHLSGAMMQDQRDEEIVELKQKLINMMKENNEMKELILFLDDERNYARQIMRDFNCKQNVNWNSLKQKMTFLEQKQVELIHENYSLKQLCVLLDENATSPQIYCHPIDSVKSSSLIGNNNSRIMSNVCQYILQLENEIRLCRGNAPVRPKAVNETIKINSLRDSIESASAEERSILENLSETAIKSILNR